ncbi:MAG TPA: hypothetical protein VGE15_07555 [Sphingobacteriaceae bacterium]
MKTIHYIRSINAERKKRLIYAALFLLAVSAGTILWHPDADAPEPARTESQAEK